MNKVAIAYLLWLGCLFTPHLAGLHRLYNGKIGTGLLWLFTCGLFGAGQLVDLFLIPSMVDEYNIEARARLGLSPTGVPFSPPAIAQTVIEKPPLALVPKTPRDQLIVKLVKAAYARGGQLSVTSGVMETEASFAEVEAALKQMLKTGYVTVDNHPVTGVVIYEFIELLTDVTK